MIDPENPEKQNGMGDGNTLYIPDVPPKKKVRWG
jgi:hypothetical protein